MKTISTALRGWAAGRLWAIKPGALDALLATADGRRLRAGLFDDGPECDPEDCGPDDEVPDYPDFLTVVDGVAIIPVNGPLVESQSPCEDEMLALFGGTSYGSVRARAAAALDSPSVLAAMIEIDSPGGTVCGVESAGQAIKKLASAKPTIAFVRNMADSAGYWLACASPRIIAEGRLSEVGSIGVATRAIDPRRGLKDAGIDVYEFTSTNAPRKWPDVATEAGRQQIQGEIDEAEIAFLDHVAAGRGVSLATVLDDFGRGAVLLADDALAVRMIDEIADRDAVLGRLAERGRAVQLANGSPPSVPATSQPFRPAARAAGVSRPSRPAAVARGRTVPCQ